MSDVPGYSPSTVEVIELVSRLLRGETDGWVAFDARFRGFVLATARACGMTEQDAEDLYQDLALRLPGKLPSYTPQPTGAGGFRGWLGVVVRNMAVDFFRRRANRGGTEFLRDEVAVAERFSVVVAAELDRRFLAEALDRLLAEKFRMPWVGEAWRLFWLDGLTPEEVAARVGVSYDAAARTLHRVKAYLADNTEVARLTGRAEEPPA